MFSDISHDREDVKKLLAEIMTKDLGIVENPGEAKFCLCPTANVFGETTACVVNPNNVSIHGSHQCLTASSNIAEDQTLEEEKKVFQKFYPHKALLRARSFEAQDTATRLSLAPTP
jgi:hypothetical protein